MYNCSPSYHHPCTGSITHTYILNVCMYIHMYTYNCLPHVLTCICAAVPALAPKDRDRCAFFPLGCTSLGLWMLKDFDAAMITSAARSMPTVGWTHTHTYVRMYIPMSSITVYNYVCMCIRMCICMHICVHTRYSTYVHIHVTTYISHSNTLYKRTYVRTYVRTHVCTYIKQEDIKVYTDMPTLLCLRTASSDTMRTYVTRESWLQYTMNTCGAMREWTLCC